MAKERWLPIPNYEGLYEVSDFGQIRSVYRVQKNKYTEFTVKGKLKKARKNQSRNLVVDLFKNNRYTRYQVNQLVANGFIPNPDEYRYVRHLDGDKSNCHYLNLAWGEDDLTETQRKRYESSRRSHLKRMYGITLEDYKLLFDKQNGCCAICERHQDDVRGTFHVDHSHKDGRIRGLLCNNCNKYIVSNHEDGELLRRAGDYIEFSSTGFFVPEEFLSGRRKRRKRK